MDNVTVGDPVVPSPLNDKVAIAAFISACVPINPISSWLLASNLQLVGSLELSEV